MRTSRTFNNCSYLLLPAIWTLFLFEICWDRNPPWHIYKGIFRYSHRNWPTKMPLHSPDCILILNKDDSWNGKDRVESFLPVIPTRIILFILTELSFQVVRRISLMKIRPNPFAWASSFIYQMAFQPLRSSLSPLATTESLNAYMGCVGLNIYPFWWQSFHVSAVFNMLSVQ